ncbi:unnamed protein product [Victoria cruziana]
MDKCLALLAAGSDWENCSEPSH